MAYTFKPEYEFSKGIAYAEFLTPQMTAFSHFPSM